MSAVFFLVAGIIIIRLANLQILDGKLFRIRGETQRGEATVIPAERGTIYAFDPIHHERIPIALTVTRYIVSANPKIIENIHAVAEKLGTLLGSSQEDIESKLSNKEVSYVVLAREVTPPVAQSLRSLKLAGIGLERTLSRAYPHGSLYAHLTGFFGYTGDTREGRYGLEETFNDRLVGRDGAVVAEHGVRGEVIPASITEEHEPVPGSDVMVTIDPAVQYATCRALQTGFTKVKARSAVAIVVNPDTGDIWALCGAPEFDPNRYGEVKNLRTFQNTALVSYEPGSVFKSITMAGAIDADAVEASTTFTDTGSLKIGGFMIANALHKVYGLQTMTGVLENSINTGAVFAARALGVEKFRALVDHFGFGTVTATGLKGESGGDTRQLEDHKEIYMATASFGQGITTTPLQLIAAYGAIANGGRLPELRLVTAIEADGRAIESYPNKIIRNVIAPDTAATLRAMLTSVVEHGHSKGARIPGYHTAGKTGTAQIPKINGRGYSNETNHTFIGFAPSSKPRFVVLVKFEAPQNGPFAENTATPVFREITKFLLSYLAVPPER